MALMEINEVCKWTSIVKKYPDMWVFMTDVKEKNGQIDTCRVLAICNHSEKAKYISLFKDKGINFECERTTFSAPNIGVLF